MRKLALALIVLIIGILSAQEVFAGFGITPPYVRNDRLTRGSVYKQEIILVRGDPIEDLETEITINVTSINDWFSVDRGLNFTLPKGEKQFPITVSVQVPDDAKYDRHRGNIRIRTSSKEIPTEGVSIALGAQVDVDISVVDKVLDFDVRRISVADLEEGYKKWWLDFPGKIKFLMMVENTGNFKFGPTKVIFDIYDREGKVLLESTENKNSIERVAPFGTKEVIAEIPTHLPNGRYLVKYMIFKKDQIAQEGEIPISLALRGAIQGHKPYGFNGLSLFDKLTLIVPIPLLLLLAWAFYRSRNKKTILKNPPIAQTPNRNIMR